MNTYDVIEFSKIYKRVLSVELCLKDKIKKALIKTYPNKSFNRLIPYLIKILPHKKYISNSRDRINDIINSNKSQETKLKKFLKIAYLWDVLKILTIYDEIRKDLRFKKNFYGNAPKQNIIEVHAEALNDLRNCVMHFKFDDYIKNKNNFLNSLGFWERLLYCPNAFLHSLPPTKPKISKILKLLADYCPNFFELDDRIICDMFDDLAFLNGKAIKDLPKLWTIGRGIYLLKRKIKNAK